MKPRDAARLILHSVVGALIALLFSGVAAYPQQKQAPPPKRPAVAPRPSGEQPATQNAARPQAGNENSNQQSQSSNGSAGYSPNSMQSGTAPCNQAVSSPYGRAPIRPCNAATSQAQNSNRQALNASQEGYGKFPGGGGYSMTLYSCFRSGGQVLCDFDLTNQHNAQIAAKSAYPGLHFVSSSGRMFPRSDAFFVDTDGSQFDDSQITPGNKVRLIMVFDNVPASLTSASLAAGPTVVQNVAISAQEEGTAPQSASSGKSSPSPK
jgi:hypothetical protein